jgi:hypothetical protein
MNMMIGTRDMRNTYGNHVLILRELNINYSVHKILPLDLNPRHIFLFEYWGVESILGPHGTAAAPGLLYLLRVILRMEKLVE